MKKQSIGLRQKWRALGSSVLLACLIFSPDQVLANRAELHICNAALGLGQAEARIELFGKEMDGEIPNDQRVFIQTNLSDAADEMVAAESLFRAPIVTVRAEKRTLEKVTDQITRFSTATANMSFQHQANYVANIFSDYRQGLEVTFESSRGDALRYNPNCDLFIALTCYHYGRATIASTIESNFGDSYQNGANYAFRDAIYKGQAVAMDQSDDPRDPGHSPWDGHAKKICCTMGTPMEWRAMDLGSFQWSTPLNVYREREAILRG